MDQAPFALIAAFAALPGFAIKQAINVVQLRAACKALVLLDQQRDKQAASKIL